MSSAATTAAVKAALAATAGLDASAINVDTSADGKVVTLKGTVASAAAKAAAEKTAHGAATAATIKNELVVK
jgi:osmotically-inducible protein OsmY